MVQPTAVRTGGGVGVLSPEDTWNQPTVPMRRRVRQAPVSNQWLAEAEFTDLVDAALDGDRRAVEHLLGRIQPLIVRYCRAPRRDAQKEAFAFQAATRTPADSLGLRLRRRWRRFLGMVR